MLLSQDIRAVGIISNIIQCQECTHDFEEKLFFFLYNIFVILLLAFSNLLLPDKCANKSMHRIFDKII